MSYVVTKKIGDAVYECRLSPPSETGLGTALSGKRGVLVPCGSNDEPEIYPGEKSANRAAMRTQRISNRLRNSLVSELPRLQVLLQKGEFGVKKYNV